MVSESSHEVQEGQQIAQHQEREEEERRNWRVAHEEVQQQRQVQTIGIGQQQQSEAKQQQLAVERHGQQFGRQCRAGREVRGQIRERHSPPVLRDGPAAASSSAGWLPGPSAGAPSGTVESSSHRHDGQYYQFAGAPELGKRESTGADQQPTGSQQFRTAGDQVRLRANRAVTVVTRV